MNLVLVLEEALCDIAGPDTNTPTRYCPLEPWFLSCGTSGGKCNVLGGHLHCHRAVLLMCSTMSGHSFWGTLIYFSRGVADF